MKETKELRPGKYWYAIDEYVDGQVMTSGRTEVLDYAANRVVSLMRHPDVEQVVVRKVKKGE